MDGVLIPDFIGTGAEFHNSRTDQLVALLCVHCPNRFLRAVDDPLDMIENGPLAVAGEDKVAVHAGWGHVGWDSELSSGQGLRDDDAAKDATAAGGAP